MCRACTCTTSKPASCLLVQATHPHELAEQGHRRPRRSSNNGDQLAGAAAAGGGAGGAAAAAAADDDGVPPWQRHSVSGDAQPSSSRVVSASQVQLQQQTPPGNPGGSPSPSPSPGGGPHRTAWTDPTAAVLPFGPTQPIQPPTASSSILPVAPAPPGPGHVYANPSWQPASVVPPPRPAFIRPPQYAYAPQYYGAAVAGAGVVAPYRGYAQRGPQPWCVS